MLWNSTEDFTVNTKQLYVQCTENEGTERLRKKVGGADNDEIRPQCFYGWMLAHE